MILAILDELASTLKTKQKESILHKHKDNDLLKHIFCITYNKQIMFHVKKFPTEFDQYPDETHSLSWAISQIINKLSTRQLTGNDARDHLRKVASLVNERDREVLRRIINRDLECGAGTTIPNRVWKNLIPEQPQCLATAFSEKALKRIVYPAYSQLKADGARCMADLVESYIRKVSRAGNEYTGLTDLDTSLRKLRDYLGCDYVLDGELIYINGPVVAVESDQRLMSTGRMTDEEAIALFTDIKTIPFSLDSFMDDDVLPELADSGSGIIRPSTPEEDKAEAKREEGNGIVNKSLKGTISEEEQKNIVFQVWDLIQYDQYYVDKVSTAPYCDRFSILEGALAAIGVTNIQLIPSKLVYNFAEAKKDYNDYRNEGKEGSILKNTHFFWKDSRVADQVKLKNKTPIDLRIVDVYPHTKDPNKIGGFVVEDLSGEARTNTGSGLTDTDYRYANDGVTREYIPLTERGWLDREFIMGSKDMYIGAIVEMEVDGLQTSKTRKPGEPEYSFFLPIIKKIRWDKSQPNDIHDVFADLF